MVGVVETLSKKSLLVDFRSQIWNTRTGRCEVSLSGHADSVEKIIWGGEGLLYSASRDRTIKVSKDVRFFTREATRTWTSFRIPCVSAFDSEFAAFHVVQGWRCS